MVQNGAITMEIVLEQLCALKIRARSSGVAVGLSKYERKRSDQRPAPGSRSLNVPTYTGVERGSTVAFIRFVPENEGTVQCDEMIMNCEVRIVICEL